MNAMATTATQKTTQTAFRRKMAGLGSRKASAARVSAAEVRAGLPYSTLVALAESLGLTQDVLTRVLGISERTLQRRRQSGRLSAAESDRLWRVQHVYDQALSAFDGREDAAREWLATPKRILGGDTPMAHLDTEAGARLVEQMLLVIEHTMPA